MSTLQEQALAKVRDIDSHRTAKARRTADDGVILVNGADLRPEPIRWLWPTWLALGKLHIMAGAAGQGKTTLVLALIAILTGGRRWPDGRHCDRTGNVLAWSGEDDAADTLLPRLLAMGADPKRVFFVKGSRIEGESLPFDPARDMGQLVAAAERIGNVKLLMVDPVVSAVPGDSHKNTEVRRALQPLVDLAATLDCAVIGITHFSKGSAGRDPTERVTGSLAFGAVARVVMVAGKVRCESGTERRILARAKSNIGPDEGGFEYAIEQVAVEGHTGIFASCIRWGDAVAGTARVLLAEPDDGGASGTVDEPGDDVDEFLRDLLKEGLPSASKDIRAAAREVGYAWRTVHRAGKRIGVKIKKEGLTGGWFWTLPKVPRHAEGAEHANSETLAPSAPSAPSTASADDSEVCES